MLQKLAIQNYALIDTIVIEFDKGLNIITGETGAGKSIILGALSLILGQRAESKYFFNQDKKCVIEGTFVLQNANLKSIFERNDLDYFEENILRREISTDGKSRSFVNDTPVTLAVLKLIGENLIAIHSQHATQEISDPNFQLLILDSIAAHDEKLRKYRSGFQKLKKDKALLNDLINANIEAKNRQDYEQFLFDELSSAEIIADEQDKLEQELTKLSNAEGIKRNLIVATSVLTENETSTVSLLKEAIAQLQGIEKFAPELNNIIERLRSSLIEIKDIAAETEQFEQNTLLNQERMLQIQERLNLIYNLQQKHRVKTNIELLNIQNELEISINELLSSDEKIEQLKKDIDILAANLLYEAQELSINRKNAIQIVENSVKESLVLLAMPNAKISFVQQINNDLNKDGIDDIALLFNANIGQSLSPVGKVASGGELSRLMLAIKSLLAQYTAMPTLIFDEIDTGISGETAVKVGEVIDDLGKHMQIISITHLPQIAAKGDSHYFVYKIEEQAKTLTGIKKLTQEDRINSIAEMLSGKNPSESAIQNAKDLLNK